MDDKLLIMMKYIPLYYEIKIDK